jgi:pyruvate dehydrogenase E1 component alpha subunit
MEILTYRFQGHSMGDPERYRTKEEIAQYQEGDPIGRYRKSLLEMKNPKFSEEELNDIERDVRRQIDEAEEFALNSDLPALESLTDQIYVDDLERK